MTVPDYKSPIIDELISVTNEIEGAVDSCNLGVEDSCQTRWLCRHLFGVSLSIARTILDSCRSRRFTSIGILQRSLSEWAIDLRFIAISDNPTLNSQFANYHKLLAYWRRNDIDSPRFQDQKPRIVKEYQEYVRSAFPQIAAPVAYRTHSLVLRDISPAEKAKRIVQVCPNFSFSPEQISELQRILSISYVHKTDEAEDGYWKAVDKRIKQLYSGHWSGLSVGSRVDAIRKSTSREVEDNVMRKAFSFQSNKTHTSPYGLVGFDPLTGAAPLHKHITDQVLRQYEESVYFAIDYSVKSLCSVLEPKEDRLLSVRFAQLVLQQPHFCQHFAQKLGLN